MKGKIGERNFKDYEKIIKGLAYKFAVSMPYDEVEDLIQEGYVYYLELIQMEKDGKIQCSFEAALFNHIKQNWLNKLKGYHYQKRSAIILDLEELTKDMTKNKKLCRDMNGYITKNPFLRLEKYMSLSKRIQEVVTTLYTYPEELKKELKKGGGFIPHLNNYLKKQLGWSNQEIKDFYVEFTI